MLMAFLVLIGRKLMAPTCDTRVEWRYSRDRWFGDGYDRCERPIGFAMGWPKKVSAIKYLYIETPRRL